MGINPSTIQLGVKENFKLFAILVLVNALVGSLIGLERTIIPRIAEIEFNIHNANHLFSFILVFGFSKSFTNLFSGYLFSKFGRKVILITGWVIALPIPFIFYFAHDWNWLLIANVLLGINQGLTWSATVIMKIDLSGAQNRGLAVGLNEFVGYFFLGITAFLTGWLFDRYANIHILFYYSLFVVLFGMVISLFFVKETIPWVNLEKINLVNSHPNFRNVFLSTTFFNKNLSATSQAGLITNLNDGMVWGIIPILLFEMNFSFIAIGIVVAIYPMIWGVGQLFSGMISDYYDKRKILMLGMFLQSIILPTILFSSTIEYFILIMIFLGISKAMVYPTFLTVIAENSSTDDRPKSLGVFRFWRDLGYVFGALLTGFMAHKYSIDSTIIVVSIITFFSFLVLAKRMS